MTAWLSLESLEFPQPITYRLSSALTISILIALLRYLRSTHLSLMLNYHRRVDHRMARFLIFLVSQINVGRCS
jgi:hypothetical protein